jgi:hypothetical protein
MKKGRVLIENISKPVITHTLAEARTIIAKELGIPSILVSKNWEVGDESTLTLRYKTNRIEGVLYFDVYESVKNLNQL